MGQEPNIELSEADLPRSTLQPGAARRWKPERPGEISAPHEMAEGGAFGRQGPDAGYALKLAAEADFERGRSGPTLDRMVATIAAARASLFGRAPVSGDVEVALILLGLRPDRIPTDVLAELGEARERALVRAAHEKVKGHAILEQLTPQLLMLDTDDLRRKLQSEQRDL